MKYPRYPKYKDSGVEWLGKVPEHWEVKRLKCAISSCRNGIWGDNPDGYNDIRCVRVADFDRNALRVNSEIPTLRLLPENERTGRLLHYGNLLLEKSGGGDNQPVGQVVVFDHDVEAVCSNFIAKIELTQASHPSFWNYNFAAAYNSGINIRSIKQTSGIQNLDQGQYLDEFAAYPLPAEQFIIAAFLDHNCAKIGTLIAEQEKLIALLKEKRRAVISHAVTKGLNPDASMKDSGVEWIEVVPEGWEVSRLKFLATIQTGIAKGKDYLGKQTVSVPYLRVANVQDGFLLLEDIAELEIPQEEIGRYILIPGDVLMNEGGDFDKLGRGAVWQGEIPICIHQNHVFAVRPQAVSSNWLNLLTGSNYAQNYFISRSKQSTNLASISSSNLMELPVILPPVDVQQAIITYLNCETAKIDTLIAESEKAVALLKERRNALISAAVTGKIDVRDIPLQVAV